MDSILSIGTPTPPPREGDLFKSLEIEGHRFDIYYGYYEDCERENPAIEPMPIYPDFTASPCRTATGAPFVTKMQDACRHYIGRVTDYKECAECAYYRHGDDFIGVCICPRNADPHG